MTSFTRSKWLWPVTMSGTSTAAEDAPDDLDRLGRRAVPLLGMGPLEADADEVGPVLLDARPRHLRGLAEEVAVDFPEERRILLAHEVEDFHRDERPVRHLAFPVVERHARLRRRS